MTLTNWAHFPKDLFRNNIVPFLDDRDKSNAKGVCWPWSQHLQPKWKDFPKDILEGLVFHYLELSDLVAVRRTCRDWRTVNPSHVSLGSKAVDDQVVKALSKWTNLNSLSLSNASMAKENINLDVLGLLTSLTALNLTCASILGKKTIQGRQCAFIQQLPRLCHLSLQNVADAQIKSIKNVSLESLNLCSGESSLVFNMDVTDNALLSLQPDLLRSLKWRTDAIISLTTMERLNRFKKLNELTLKMCDFRGVTFEPLKTQLTSLDLSYSKNISLQCLTSLKDFPLQQLILRDVVNSERSLDFLEHFSTTLTVLRLDRWSITTLGVGVLNSLTLLRELLLSRASCGDDHAKDLFLPALTSLDLNGNPLTDFGVAHFHKMPLRKLSLFNSQVTGTGLKGCVHLTHLDLSSAAVTDEGLDVIKSLPLRKLFLSHYDSYSFSGEGLIKLASCHSLRVLDVQRVRYFSDYARTALQGHVPHGICLSSNWNDDTGINYFLNSCKEKEIISMEGYMKRLTLDSKNRTFGTKMPYDENELNVLGISIALAIKPRELPPSASTLLTLVEKLNDAINKETALTVEDAQLLEKYIPSPTPTPSGSVEKRKVILALLYHECIPVLQGIGNSLIIKG